MQRPAGRVCGIHPDPERPARRADETPMQSTGPFDADYYRRYYEDRRTRVTDQARVRRLAAFVTAGMRHYELPLRSVLDLGCGMGFWRTAMAELAPRARYQGVEYSEYLCERFGWTRGSVVDYAPRRTFDLVVCQGVLQYLGDADATAAIANLARLCRGALYLEALTVRDWQENCDRETTDGSMKLRTGDWYRRRLRPHFLTVGGGIFLHRSAPAATFELETLA